MLLWILPISEQICLQSIDHIWGIFPLRMIVREDIPPWVLLSRASLVTVTRMMRLSHWSWHSSHILTTAALLLLSSALCKNHSVRHCSSYCTTITDSCPLLQAFWRALQCPRCAASATERTASPSIKVSKYFKVKYIFLVLINIFVRNIGGDEQSWWHYRHSRDQ